ncbi:hypothetical protein AAG906_005849 [Vitis piasezkii]
MYIYPAKRSCILYEWYLFPQSGMGGFIIGGLSTNKGVNREIVVVSGHLEFGASKPEGLLRASRVHGIPKSSTTGASLAHNIPSKSRSGGRVTRSCIDSSIWLGNVSTPHCHGVTQIDLRNQVRKSTLSTSETSNKLSLAEAKVTHLEAQVTFLTKDKEELSDFLEDTHRAKMMYGATCINYKKIG